jgi:hypothetical protein
MTIFQCDRVEVQPASLLDGTRALWIARQRLHPRPRRVKGGPPNPARNLVRRRRATLPGTRRALDAGPSSSAVHTAHHFVDCLPLPPGPAPGLFSPPTPCADDAPIGSFQP